MEFLQVIGELWKLGLVLVIFFALFIFKDPIRSLLSQSNLKFKRGELEVEVQKYSDSDSDKKVIPDQENQIIDNTLVNDEIATSISKVETEIEEQEDDFTKLFNAFVNNDIIKLESAFQELQLNESNIIKKIEYEAFYYSLKYRLGENNALKELLMLMDKSKDSEGYKTILSILGSLYDELGEFEKAIDIYQKCFVLEDDIENKYKRFKNIVKILYKSGKKQEAFNKIFDELTDNENNPKISVHLYGALIELYSVEKNSELKAFALEKIIELDPTLNRFDAAYSFSEASFEALSLLHYKTLLNFNPKNETALNNIGVQYDALGLPTKSVENYQKASELNETLASANLASNLIKIGFLKEAKEILEKATQIENCHKNVWINLSRIKTVIEEEEVKEKELLEVAKQQQLFIRSFANAYFLKSPQPEIKGIWKSTSNKEFTIKILNNMIEIDWEEYLGKYKFKGEIINNAAKLEKFKEKYDLSKSQNSFQKEEKESIFMYYNKEIDLINFMIKENSKTNYLVLSR